MSYLPIHANTFHIPNIRQNTHGCSCGCGGNSRKSSNKIAIFKNARRSMRMNGTVEDLINNFVGSVGGGQPLFKMEVGITNDSLVKLGFLGLGLIFLNREINKK